MEETEEAFRLYRKAMGRTENELVETLQTLRGVSLYYELMLDALQTPSIAEDIDPFSFVWTTNESLNACIERIEAAVNGMDEAEWEGDRGKNG